MGGRANVYLPLTGAQAVSGGAEVVLSGSNIAMVGSYEVPLWGVDAEVGARLATSADGLQQLWGHVGGYYFDSWDMAIADNVYGPQATAEYRFNDVLGPQSRLSLVASAQWDAMRGTQISAGVGLRVPFDVDHTSAPLAPLRARMAERIVRDPDIVLARSTEQVKDALTDVVFEQVEYTATPGDLGADVGAAPDNTLLIVERDYAASQTIDDAVNITIAGEGGTFAVAGLTSGNVVEYTVPGARHTIAVEGTGGDATTALAIDNGGSGIGEGVHLVGLDVTATNNAMTNGATLVAVDIDGLTSPFYLEDMYVRAQGQVASIVSGSVLSPFGLSIQGIDRETSTLVILDSDIGAKLDGGLAGAEGTSVRRRVYGLSATDGAVDVYNSQIHASFSGGVNGPTTSSGESNSTEAILAGLAATGSAVDLHGSTVYAASVDGDVTAAAPDDYPLFSSARVNLDLYGLLVSDSATTVDDNSSVFARLDDNVWGASGSSNYSNASVHGLSAFSGSTVSVTGSSSIHAEMIGNVTGTTAEASAFYGIGASVEGLYASNSIVNVSDSTVEAEASGSVREGNAYLQVSGVKTDKTTLAVDQADVSVGFDGDVDAGTNANPAFAALTIVSYGPADTLQTGYDYVLSIADSDSRMVRDGIELNDGAASYTGVSLGFAGQNAPVRLADNRFAGAFDSAGSDLVFINYQNYDFANGASTGNSTELGTTTNVPLCSQNNAAWAGSFTVDGVTYDATGGGGTACATVSP